MPKFTIQKCPVCEKFFQHGRWIFLDEDQLKALDAAIFAGSVQILEASCICCEEEGIDGLGHA